MNSKNLARRLEQLEEELIPTKDDQRVLTLTVRHIGDATTPTFTTTHDFGLLPKRRRRRPWQYR
jgi:hypothetical protein